MRFLGSVRLAAVGLLCAATLCLAPPASADDLQDCIDAGNAQGIDMPTCVERDGKLVPVETTSGPYADGGGIPSGFIVVFVLAALVGVGITVWRVSTARRLATDAGLDPDVATGITLLDENGLSATYLASSLRSPAPPGPAVAPSASTADRLGELKGLLDRGVITQAEHDERRKAIIDSV